MSGVKTTDLPLSLLRFDPSFRATSTTELSMIYNIVLDYIYNTHGHRISQWNHTILDPVSLERYAEAVYDKGAALDNCIGFIDGTVRPICRPGELT